MITSRTINNKINSPFKYHLFDPWLTLFVCTLLVVGLAILYSASDQNSQFIFHQSIRVLISLTVMMILAQIHQEHFRRWAPGIYLVVCAMLLAVLIIGQVGNGAQRWLQIGFLRIQPSEFMKLAMPIMFASYYHNKPLPADYVTHLQASLLAIGPIIATAIEPDLGTALMLAASASTMLFLAGLPWRAIITTLVGFTLTLPLLWHFMEPYQKSRVLTFLNPTRDPLGNGYHIIQSKIALGSGGMIGKGWLQSTQAHLNFLPEDTTDFIFAVLGEEFGFIGSTCLLLLFFAITCRGFQICYRAQDTFSRLLAGGLTIIFFLSAFVNIGMVTGLLPVVGLPLPLISYGGTSLVTLMASLGILMSIHNHKKLIGH